MTSHPGFLAVTRDAPGGGDAPIDMTTWEIDRDVADGIVLCREARRGRAVVSADAARTMLDDAHRRELVDVLPPFAAVTRQPGRVVAATDAIGYRHLYVRRGAGWSATSTSLPALAALAPVALDRQALAVQSLLGWQLGRRTIYEGVEKLLAGHSVTLRDGRATVEPYVDGGLPPAVDSQTAVRNAASFLREYLDSYLDDQPDATLQLSGGQDSRILLSAIDRRRRRGLAAMTLRVPGSEDASIAADLARHEGLDHHVISMDGLADLAPDRAHAMCVAASRRISYMANPLATAALVHAEAAADKGPRLAGLGGEVARGFYYSGPILPWPINRFSAGALARWRMFTNEAVPDGVLTTDFARWAREFTIDEVLAALASTGQSWWAATDEFYLFQRMQRWAGVTDSASCFERTTINPMLDRTFLDLSRGLRPGDKKGSRFLGRLQVALDAELARLPMDGRPAPEVFARGGIASTWTRANLMTGKVVGKVRQRIRRTRKPPAGGAVLAAKVLEHWREDPSTLAVVADIDVVDTSWLHSVLDGGVEPEPSAVAFLLNVATAAADAGQQQGTLDSR